MKEFCVEDNSLEVRSNRCIDSNFDELTYAPCLSLNADLYRAFPSYLADLYDCVKVTTWSNKSQQRVSYYCYFFHH